MFLRYATARINGPNVMTSVLFPDNHVLIDYGIKQCVMCTGNGFEYKLCLEFSCFHLCAIMCVAY